MNNSDVERVKVFVADVHFSAVSIPGERCERHAQLPSTASIPAGQMAKSAIIWGRDFVFDGKKRRSESKKTKCDNGFGRAIAF
jgi:hypothetical protein